MIRKARFLAKEAKLRVKYMTSKGCLFCKIVAGQIKAEIVMESDKSMAFLDVNPVYEKHILIVPKVHIGSVGDLKVDNAEDLLDMYNIANRLVVRNKLDAYRLSVNGGKFQHVPHLHLHLMAGKKLV